MDEQEQYSNSNESLLSEVSVKLRDIEEKQNIIKDRVLLIGENLISEKEEVERQVQELKSDIIKLNEETRKIKLVIERVMDELNNFVRKNEFEILQKQFKMFEPLQLARITDVEYMINQALKTKK